MMDYIGAAALFIFMVLVLVWLRRRERRDRLASESLEHQLTSEGQHHDDQLG
jgi:cbb3-type cytochrome oxidase subunit 3